MSKQQKPARNTAKRQKITRQIDAFEQIVQNIVKAIVSSPL